MSNRETAVEIHITLDALKAPPNASIAERIRGLVGPAAAALHEAGFVVGEGTLADGITEALADIKNARVLAGTQINASGTLSDVVSRLMDLRTWALAQRDEQVLIRGRAQQAEADALDQCRLATERADRMDAQWAAAERRATALEEEAQRLRADVARLSNQLDYATELCLAGFRQ